MLHDHHDPTIPTIRADKNPTNIQPQHCQRCEFGQVFWFPALVCIARPRLTLAPLPELFQGLDEAPGENSVPRVAT